MCSTRLGLFTVPGLPSLSIKQGLRPYYEIRPMKEKQPNLPPTRDLFPSRCARHAPTRVASIERRPAAGQRAAGGDPPSSWRPIVAPLRPCSEHPWPGRLTVESAGQRPRSPAASPPCSRRPFRLQKKLCAPAPSIPGPLTVESAGFLHPSRIQSSQFLDPRLLRSSLCSVSL